MAKLPIYIDNYIYDELGGYYMIGQNVDYNLTNNEEQNKRYLGTYFPRSLIECYFILKDIYEHKLIKAVIDTKEKLTILDIGTGTGGNMIGLLHFLKSIAFNREVVIYTIEGNLNAIEYQKKVFIKFNKTYNTNYKLRYANITFTASTLCDQISSFIRQRNLNFDIITSFKFISEFYNTDYENAFGIKLYKSFANTISNFLVQDGIFLLLDLVSGNYDHNNPRPYTTQIISNELNNLIRDTNCNLKYILPICCGLWSHQCRTHNCYIERHFKIEHSLSNNDLSKVAYRVMVPEIFSQRILADVEEHERYQMSYNQWHPRYCENSTTIEINEEKVLPSAFKLL